MAEPLGRSVSIRLLEDAIHLLRRTPAATLACHAVGSVPLALTALFLWNDATNTHTTDAAWARESLVLALVLLWMNAWRSVFAGRLRHQLSGTADRPWTAARVLHLVAVQSFYGASKLVVLPFSALILFPWADVLAFYRNLAVLAGRDDLSPREAVRQARRLTRFQKAQSWRLLPLLLLLWLIVALNMAIAVGLLPQLVRILTGYETAYSRSGMYFVSNPMFLLLVLALTWIVFDPFVQAVYTLRAFQAESMETGEDLRCGLRRVAARATIAAVLALLILAAPQLRAEVAPAELEKSVRQTMQSHEYDWRFPPASETANTPWIVTVTDRLVAAARKAGNAIGEVMRRFFKWLGDKLKLSGPNPADAPASEVSLLVVGLLILIVVLGGAAFAWYMRRKKPREVTAVDPLASIHLGAADLTADLLPEESWIALAERSLAEQNFRFALRAFYLASLAWLGRQEYISIHPGKTDSEYENELRRRTHGTPEARVLFGGNTAAFARAWYGLHEVSPDDVAQFRERAGSLKTLLEPVKEVAA